MKSKHNDLNAQSSIKIRETTKNDSAWIADLMTRAWGGEPLIIRGRDYFATALPGLLAESEGNFTGFLSYEIANSECEIVVFDVFDKFKGLGSLLLDELKKIARSASCKRIFLQTSNDNLDALRFYQRRGFVISGIHLDTIRFARQRKPCIVEIGDYGIPVRDEIDLEFVL